MANATMTSGVHAIRLPNETMTEAVHRTKTASETFTEQQHDLVATIENAALPSGTFAAPVGSLQDASSFTATWVAPSAGDEVTNYSVEVLDNGTGLDIAGSPFTVNHDVLALAVSGLDASTQYDVTVDAYNAGGSASSTQANISTTA